MDRREWRHEYFAKKNLFCVCPAMESVTGGVAIGAGPGGGRPIVGGFLGQKLQVPRNVFTSKGQLVLSYSRFLNFSSSVFLSRVQKPGF